MKINKLARTLIFALAALMSLSVFAPCAYAAEDKPLYVAFGDSIAFGYGLSDAQSDGFVYLLSNSLETECVNYAVNGMTSGGLFTLLESFAEGSDDYNNVKNASLITVTIGSNDLLGRLSTIWSQAVNAAGGQLNDTAFAALEASLTSEAAMTSFDEGIAEYGRKLPFICEWLKSVNPTAQIIMTRFYNPYYGVMFGNFDFSTLCDGYITRMNEVLDAGAAIYGYTIADSYTPFNAPSMTNVDMTTGNFDPHPNIAGHMAIFKAVEAVVDKAALQVSAEPETTVEETTAEQTTTAESVTEAETEAATAEQSGSNIGKIALAAVAIAAFAATGIIMSYRNKKAKK